MRKFIPMSLAYIITYCGVVLYANQMFGVGTPTFDGTRDERYAKGMQYYKAKMGFSQAVVYVPNEYPWWKYCGWVRRGRTEAIVETAYNACWACWDSTPEQVALHEACHIHLGHTKKLMDSKDMTVKHREVDACMHHFAEEKATWF